MCAEWAGSFDAFLRDMGEMPEWCNSLDRIDPDGNYEPGNCRWANPAMQGKNTRRNVFLTFCGVTMIASDWSRAIGTPLPTIYSRKRRGYADCDCLGLAW
jgi:hypothetical protein